MRSEVVALAQHQPDKRLLSQRVRRPRPEGPVPERLRLHQALPHSAARGLSDGLVHGYNGGLKMVANKTVLQLG